MANPYDPYDSFSGGFSESGQLQGPTEAPEWSPMDADVNFQPDSLPAPAHFDDRSTFHNALSGGITSSDQDSHHKPTALMSHRLLNNLLLDADPTDSTSKGSISAGGPSFAYAKNPEDSPSMANQFSDNGISIVSERQQSLSEMQFKLQKERVTMSHYPSPSSSSLHSSRNSVSERSASSSQSIVQLGNRPVNRRPRLTPSAKRSGSSSGPPSTAASSRRRRKTTDTPENPPLANSTTTRQMWDYIKYVARDKTYEEYFPPYTDVDLRDVFNTACTIYGEQTGDKTDIRSPPQESLHKICKECSSKTRRADMAKMFKDGLSSKPPPLQIGFIVPPIIPWHRMHNYDVHCQILSEHQRAFDNGDNDALLKYLMSIAFESYMSAIFSSVPHNNRITLAQRLYGQHRRFMPSAYIYTTMMHYNWAHCFSDGLQAVVTHSEDRLWSRLQIVKGRIMSIADNVNFAEHSSRSYRYCIMLHN